MTTDYLLFAPQDKPLAERIVGNLRTHAITVEPLTLTQALGVSSASTLIMVLSNTLAKNPAFLDVLDQFVHSTPKPHFIVLRVGVLEEFPYQLKGVLPIDFSKSEDYDTAFASLVSELNMQDKTSPILPEEVIQALDSADATERQQGVQLLRQLWEDGSPEVQEAVETELQNITFREQDPTVRQLARVTLQLHQQDVTPEVLPTPPAPQTPVSIIPETLAVLKNAPTETLPKDMPDAPTRPLTKLPHEEIVPTTAQPRWLWQTSAWWIQLGVSIGLGIGMALASDNVLVALPIIIPWGFMLWLNIAIRDGGRFVWVMPGALIGNALIGMIGSFMLAAIITLFSDFAILGIIGLGIVGFSYGSLVGWLSTLKDHPTSIG